MVKDVAIAKMQVKMGQGGGAVGDAVREAEHANEKAALARQLQMMTSKMATLETETRLRVQDEKERGLLDL